VSVSLAISGLIAPTSHEVYVQEQVPVRIITASSTRAEVIEIITERATALELDPAQVLKIAYCESSFKVNALNTKTVIGHDSFLMQINSHFHADTMNEMGLNYDNPDDSLNYGLWLLKEQGTKPWNASKKCWTSEKDWGTLLKP